MFGFVVFLPSPFVVQKCQSLHLLLLSNLSIVSLASGIVGMVRGVSIGRSKKSSEFSSLRSGSGLGGNTGVSSFGSPFGTANGLTKTDGIVFVNWVGSYR